MEFEIKLYYCEELGGNHSEHLIKLFSTIEIIINFPLINHEQVTVAMVKIRKYVKKQFSLYVCKFQISFFQLH